MVVGVGVGVVVVVVEVEKVTVAMSTFNKFDKLDNRTSQAAESSEF